MIVPSAVGFICLGDVIVALFFQSGHFSHADAVYVWSVLAGSGVGMLATTMVQLYNSAFYALWDTKTPFRLALVRVTLTMALGYLSAIVLPPVIGIAQRWGVAGLTASAGVSGWVEFTLLRLRLNRRIGPTGLDRVFVTKLWAMALGAAAIGFGLKLLTASLGPRLQGLMVLSAYGTSYLGAARVLKLPELDKFLGMIRRQFNPPASAR